MRFLPLPRPTLIETPKRGDPLLDLPRVVRFRPRFLHPFGLPAGRGQAPPLHGDGRFPGFRWGGRPLAPPLGELSSKARLKGHLPGGSHSPEAAESPRFPAGRGRAPPLHEDGRFPVLRRGDFQTARRSQSCRRGPRPRRMQKAAQLPHVFRVLRSFSILLKEIRSRISGCSARNTRRSDGSASPAGR